MNAMRIESRTAYSRALDPAESAWNRRPKSSPRRELLARFGLRFPIDNEIEPNIVRLDAARLVVSLGTYPQIGNAEAGSSRQTLRMLPNRNVMHELVRGGMKLRIKEPPKQRWSDLANAPKQSINSVQMAGAQSSYLDFAAESCLSFSSCTASRAARCSRAASATEMFVSVLPLKTSLPGRPSILGSTRAAKNTQAVR